MARESSAGNSSTLDASPATAYASRYSMQTGLESGMNPVVNTDGLTPSQQRVLERVQSAAGGLTATEIATTLGNHVNSIRDHLRVLEQRGLVEARARRESGAGRPTLSYHSLVAAGPSAAEFVALVASGVELIGPDDATLRAWGRRWGELAATTSNETDASTPTPTPPSDPQSRTLDLMNRMGFAPLQQANTVELCRCPLWPKDSRLDLGVCTLHAGLLEEVVGSDAVLEPLVAPSICRVVWHTDE